MAKANIIPVSFSREYKKEYELIKQMDNKSAIVCKALRAYLETNSISNHKEVVNTVVKNTEDKKVIKNLKESLNLDI